MNTCTITVSIHVGPSCEYGREADIVRVWEGVDVMKTSHTRAWATRQFNKLWKDRGPDIPIRVYWRQVYDDTNLGSLSGILSGVNNLRHKRGIFEW